jgi:hypothetical protein
MPVQRARTQKFSHSQIWSLQHFIFNDLVSWDLQGFLITPARISIFPSTLENLHDEDGKGKQGTASDSKLIYKQKGSEGHFAGGLLTLFKLVNAGARTA